MKAEDPKRVKAREFIMRFTKYAESSPIVSDLHPETGTQGTLFSNAKHLAIIAVEEIIFALGMIQDDISDKVFIHWNEFKKLLEEY